MVLVWSLIPLFVGVAMILYVLVGCRRCEIHCRARGN